jgi:DNA end-binding protein Ku
MLAIPVKLYTASKDVAPKFNRLHKTCSTRIAVVNRCNKCNVDVPWEDIINGHEVAPGEYVAFTKDEIAEAKESEKTAIQIVHTTAISGLTPNLFDTTYWIGAASKRAKAYVLLRDVLAERQAVAIASVTLRTRPRLCMIGAQAGLLTLTTLHYQEEMVDAKELVPPELKVSDGERSLAIQLVDGQMEDFDPSAHTDEYVRKLLERVSEKVEEGEVVADTHEHEAKEKSGGAAKGAEVLDLEDLLKRTIKGAKGGKGKDGGEAKSKGKDKPGKIHDARRAS